MITHSLLTMKKDLLFFLGGGGLLTFSLQLTLKVNFIMKLSNNPLSGTCNLYLNLYNGVY